MPHPPCRGDYSEDPQLGRSVFELLEVVFPGLAGTAARAARLGASWESVSTPFVLFEGEAVVAHVGRIDLPLVLAGRPRTVGTLHAVATHPERRGRGLFRRVMEEVIRDSEGAYDTLVLTTESPEFYEPFGFRVVEEHEFRVRVPRRDVPGPASAEAIRPARALDLEREEDRKRLRRLLRDREPVSRVCGVVRESAIFCFNEGGGPLLYSEDLDALFVLERREGRVDLFDVVGASVPPLPRLLERLEPGVEEVRIHFAPDQLGVEATPVARRFEHQGPSFLMVRGAELTREPFSLPRPART